MPSSHETELDGVQTAACVEVERMQDVQAVSECSAQDIATFDPVPLTSTDPEAVRKRLLALVGIVADIEHSPADSRSFPPPNVSGPRLTIVSDSYRSTAYHEAGHAVAHVRCGSELNIATTTLDEDTLDVVTVTGARDENLICYYAGYAVDLAHGRDPALAREMARFDFESAREFDSRHDEAAWIDKSREFVRENWAAIELIATQLQEHEVLFDDLYALVEVADGESTMEDLDRSRAYYRFANDLARRPPAAHIHVCK
jgi:hypothetical protein